MKLCTNMLFCKCFGLGWSWVGLELVLGLSWVGLGPSRHMAGRPMQRKKHNAWKTPMPNTICNLPVTPLRANALRKYTKVVLAPVVLFKHCVWMFVCYGMRPCDPGSEEKRKVSKTPILRTKLRSHPETVHGQCFNKNNETVLTPPVLHQKTGG